MKLMLLFLSFFNFVVAAYVSITPERIDEIQINFLNEVDKGYEYYVQYDNVDTEEYSLLIVNGIYNKTGCYGISFVPSTTNAYYIVLETDKSLFTLSRTQYQEKAIAIKADIDYTITIYDKNNNKVETFNSISLKKFSSSDFDKTSAIEGKGSGASFTVLNSYTKNLRFLPVLLITLASLICFVGLVILVLFVMKKGFFNKEKRKEGVVSMRDIYEAKTNDQEEQEITFEPNENTKDVSDTIIPVINPNKRDEDENVTSKIEDIKAYLQDQGFVIDYSILDEEEKNKIMMELIKLKNDGSISLDAYYKETYELWKK